jgi:hypothetical protein
MVLRSVRSVTILFSNSIKNLRLFTRRLPPIFFPPSVSVLAMTTYSCTVSTEIGAALDDAKAHYVKDKSGRLVLFQNPFPSFGRWKDLSNIRAGFIFLRYVSPRFLF